MDHEHGDGATDPDVTPPESAAGDVPTASPAWGNDDHEPAVDLQPVEPTPEEAAQPEFAQAEPAPPAAPQPTPDEAAPPVAPQPAPSWAWSTEAATAPSEPVRPASGSAGAKRERSGLRAALVGGIAGALVGALIAGGLVAAFDDDPEPQPVRTETQAASEPARPAAQTVEPGNIRSILDTARPAVVRIDVGRGGQTQGTGTGFVVDSSGVIVTNAHVVNGFDDVEVHLADGDAIRGDVVGADTSLDLAIVKIDRSGLPSLELGNSDTLEVGDAVVAIGNALGISEGSGATVTTGIVSGLDRVVEVSAEETLFNAIQTDAAINPGNSGGPLVDMNGRVIGINTAIASPETANNVGFAISISSAKPVIDALRAGRQPQIAFLGVASEPLTTDTADELGVSQGAVVAEVTQGSAADDAGIKVGDVIVEVDGTQINSVQDVAGNVRKHSPGDKLDIVIVRDGKRQTLTVKLGERPQNS